MIVYRVAMAIMIVVCRCILFGRAVIADIARLRMSAECGRAPRAHRVVDIHVWHRRDRG